jgi:hypothetical protein
MTSPRIYRGERTATGPRVTVDGAPLPPRTDLHAWTQGELDWGAFSRPAHQLALALLADALGEALALSLTGAFSAQVVQLLPDTWTLTCDDIADWFRTLPP